MNGACAVLGLKRTKCGILPGDDLGRIFFVTDADRIVCLKLYRKWQNCGGNAVEMYIGICYNF